MDAIAQAVAGFTMSDWMLVFVPIVLLGLWASGGFKGRGK